MGLQKILPESKLRAKAFLLNVILPLFIGGLLYIFFRDQSLRMFRWFGQLGLSEYMRDIRASVYPMARYVPDWAVYSLPDGLWVYSFSSAHHMLWKGNRAALGFFLMMAMIFGCGAEAMQALGLVSGTFDWTDFIFCLSAVLLSIIIQYISNDEQNNINQGTGKLGADGWISFSGLWERRRQEA